MDPILKENILKGFDIIKSLYQVLFDQKLIEKRESQIDLSTKVFRSFLEKTPSLIEAPTGTGKTLAYLIGALAYKKLTYEKGAVVFSTATKALQEQLVSKDLKVLVSAGFIRPDEIQLSKGKNNYLCLKQAKAIESLLEELMDDPEKYAPDYAFEIDFFRLRQMIEDFESASWNGDFDNYPEVLPGPTKPIAVDENRCTYRKCPHFKECAYFSAKEKALESKIIVTNHDLILRESVFASEIRQGSTKAEAEVAKQKSFNVIFDEAHHLPQKALKIGTKSISLHQLSEKLKFLYGFTRFANKLKDEGVPYVLPTGSWPEIDPKIIEKTESQLEDFKVFAESCDYDSNNQKIFSSELTGFPDVKELILNLQLCNAKVSEAKSVYTLLNEAKYSKDQLTIIQEYFDRSFDAQALLETAIVLLSVSKATVHIEQAVFWISKSEVGFKEDYSLFKAPLSSELFFKDTIWSPYSLVKNAVFLSATMTDTSGFDRIKKDLGCPSATREATLKSSFDYSKSTLEVVDMKYAPSQKEREFFMEELMEKLPSLINPSEGTLIILNSWAHLNKIAPELKAVFGSTTVKVQGEKQTPLLVNDHKKDIDNGKGSILIGVATLSEGLDLPGNYCTHVIIPTLPFSVPTDPVERRLQELMGDSYFNKKSLPEASLKLIQAVGRLVRRETDYGRISILDKRLKTTKYGKEMLKKLPPFKLI